MYALSYDEPSSDGSANVPGNGGHFSSAPEKKENTNSNNILVSDSFRGGCVCVRQARFLFVFVVSRPWGRQMHMLAQHQAHFVLSLFVTVHPSAHLPMTDLPKRLLFLASLCCYRMLPPPNSFFPHVHIFFQGGQEGARPTLPSGRGKGQIEITALIVYSSQGEKRKGKVKEEEREEEALDSEKKIRNIFQGQKAEFYAEPFPSISAFGYNFLVFFPPALIALCIGRGPSSNELLRHFSHTM